MLKKCCLETIYIKVTDDNIEEILKDLTDADESRRYYDIEKPTYQIFEGSKQYDVIYRESISGPVLGSFTLKVGYVYVRVNDNGYWRWRRIAHVAVVSGITI